MDIRLHSLSELTETLLDQIPQNQYKVRRRLPQIHALLSKYIQQKSHLQSSAEQKTKDLLMGTTYNPSSIEAIMTKVSQESQLYDLGEEQSVQDPEDSVKKFSQLILQSCVDTCTEFSLSSLNTLHRRKMNENWLSIKQKIVDSRGIDYFTVPSPKRQKNVQEVPVYTSAYHTIVSNFFYSKTEGKPCNVIQEFIQLEVNRKELDRDNLQSIWKIVQAQIDSAKDEEGSAEFHTLGACRFFEKQYLEKILESTFEEKIEKKVVEYAVHLSKGVKSYKPESDKNGVPVWCYLFVLMRSGLLDQARNYVNSCGAANEYYDYFNQYIDNGELSESLLNSLLNLIKRDYIGDAYLRALLHILSKSNEDIDEIQDGSLEDYLWMKLKMVSYYDLETIEYLENEFSYSALLLSDLQKYIIDCGPRHFNNNVCLYMTALISSLSYGEAVMYLYEQSEYQTEALHLAIVLKDFKLLPTFVNSDKMFESIDGIVHVNLNKMISLYIKPFLSILPNEALMYISFMTGGKSIVNEASSLVVGYENYQIVLNKEVYIFQTSFRQAVGESNFKLSVETIAEYALSQKSPEASYLFDLVNNESSVLKSWIFEIKNEIKKLADKWKNELSKVYSAREEKAKCEMINYPALNYSKLWDRYKREGVFDRLNELNFSISVLNGFLTFYTAITLRQFRHSLNILAGLQVLPMRPVLKWVEYQGRFRRLIDDAKEELPRVILTALEVSQVIISKSAGQEEDIRTDMRSLIDVYGELQGCSKGLSAVERKFSIYGNSVREVSSSLLISY